MLVSRVQVSRFNKKMLAAVIICGVILAVAWHFYSPKITIASNSSTSNSGAPNSTALSSTTDKSPSALNRPDGGKRRGAANNFPTAVVAVQAKINPIKDVQTSIGTVVPTAEVVVHSRVSGQVTKILFEEGQWVKQGQLLAQIDPRTFEADLAQIQGQADRNKALLHNAEQDLERYLSLRTQSAISQQQIDSQKTLVAQYQGAVLADKGALERAKLQLSFTQITAPIEGRIGLRNLDAGNNIAPGDALGLAIITQVQPVNVVFTLPEDSLPLLLQAYAASKSGKNPLAVEAWDKSNRQSLAFGEVNSLDNRIDPTTGTIKVKASFANKDLRLFPNQFVNLRLQLSEDNASTTVPITAIQRNTQGTFVYVVQNNPPAPESLESASSERPNRPSQSVNIRAVKTGTTESNQIAILEGLSEGEWVVTQGVDKLRDGAKVIATTDNGDELNAHSQNSYENKSEVAPEKRKGKKHAEQKS